MLHLHIVTHTSRAHRVERKVPECINGAAGARAVLHVGNAHILVERRHLEHRVIGHQRTTHPRPQPEGWLRNSQPREASSVPQDVNLGAGRIGAHQAEGAGEFRAQGGELRVSGGECRARGGEFTAREGKFTRQRVRLRARLRVGKVNAGCQE
eukprot:8160682-Pyramimonas_sp.AAC.1